MRGSDPIELRCLLLLEVPVEPRGERRVHHERGRARSDERDDGERGAETEREGVPQRWSLPGRGRAEAPALRIGADLRTCTRCPEP